MNECMDNGAYRTPSSYLTAATPHQGIIQLHIVHILK